MQRKKAAKKELVGKLFDSVQEFDADKNGFIDRDEMKAYLKAVGEWESEPLYTEAEWSVSWPHLLEMLGAEDIEKGLPLASFQLYHERYRGGKLVSDLHRVSTASKDVAGDSVVAAAAVVIHALVLYYCTLDRNFCSCLR